MDDIGNILYILIVLLSIIFGAFKKKKKPVAPPPQEKQKRPSFDPMEELETFLERFDDNKQTEEKEEVPDVVLKEDTDFTPSMEREEVKNPYMRHLDDERFNEAVPQTFSDELIYSDDIKDVAPDTGIDNADLTTERTFDEQIEFEKKMRARNKYNLKKFNAKDAIVYSAIINRPYQ